MARLPTTVLVAVATLFAPGARGSAEVRDGGPSRSRPEPRPLPAARFPRLPPLFVEYGGPADAPVAFTARGKDRSVHFGDRGVTIDQRRGGRRFAVALDFVGARAGVRPEGRDPAPTMVSVLKGPREKWRAGLRAFATLVYPDLWPGIDLVFAAEETRIKYRFLVRPGADPGCVRLRWRGGSSVGVDASGGLVVETPLGAIRDERPVAWQEAAGGPVPAAAAYAPGEAAADGSREVGFRLGEIDPALPLVIDPAIALYSGFLGGGSDDRAWGVAVDKGGSAFVAGDTSSDDFPVTVGALDTARDNRDAFVAKVLPSGTGFEWVTFLGGSGDDIAYAVALGPTGDPLVAGLTDSGQATFPVVVGPFLANAGGDDAFVARLNASGTALVYCGYIGGADSDFATGVAVDAAGNAYVAGNTRSHENTFPDLIGPSTDFNGPASSALYDDAFVAKVKADGSGLDYCGYLGGPEYDGANGIAVTPGGVAVVVGASDSIVFLLNVGPDLTYNGGRDAFVARVQADGAFVVYSGFIGGSGLDEAWAVALDGDGNAYVCGRTASTEATFPESGGPDLTANGGDDAFVAKVNPAGTAIVHCGFLGGSGADRAYGIAVDGQGRAVVCGSTDSDEAGGGFPVLVGPDLTYNGNYEAFLARVAADGSGLDRCGYLGGTASEVGFAVALSARGDAFVAGYTTSAEDSFPVAGGPDVTANGSTDAFVARIGEPPPPPIDSSLVAGKVTLRLNANDPSRSTLAVTGFLDAGSGDVDLSAAAAVDLGGYPVNAPALAAASNGRTFRYRADGVDLSIVLSPTGSSKAAFKVKVTGDLAGTVDPDEPLALRFTNPDVDAAGLVDLAGGRFALAAGAGALGEPGLFVAKGKAALKGSGEDALSLLLGFATDGLAPGEAVPVTVGFGDVFSVTVPAESFARREDRDEFRGDLDGVTQVIVDWAKGTVAVKGKRLDLGAFGAGPVPVVVSLSLGGDERAVRVRMGRKGIALVY